jgi:hypothetical protein
VRSIGILMYECDETGVVKRAMILAGPKEQIGFVLPASMLTFATSKKLSHQELAPHNLKHRVRTVIGRLPCSGRTEVAQPNTNT